MSVLSALRADFLSAKLPRAVAMGGLMGAVIVIHCFALATIVFSGPLLPFALHGAGMMLFGGAAFCLLAGAFSNTEMSLNAGRGEEVNRVGVRGVECRTRGCIEEG